MTDHQTKPAECWNCGTALDGHMNVSGEGKPESGNLSICIYCGAWGVLWIVGDQVNLMEPDTETWLQITTEADLIQASYMTCMFRKDHDIGVPEK